MSCASLVADEIGRREAQGHGLRDGAGRFVPRPGEGDLPHVDAQAGLGLETGMLLGGHADVPLLRIHAHPRGLAGCAGLEALEVDDAESLIVLLGIAEHGVVQSSRG